MVLSFWMLSGNPFRVFWLVIFDINSMLQRVCFQLLDANRRRLTFGVDKSMNCFQDSQGQLAQQSRENLLLTVCSWFGMFESI